MPGAVVGSSAVTTSNLDEALALFADVAEARLRNLPEADRALERTYLLGSAASPSLAERALAFEIEQGSGVVERLLEYGFEGSFQFAGAEGPREVESAAKPIASTFSPTTPCASSFNRSRAETGALLQCRSTVSASSAPGAAAGETADAQPCGLRRVRNAFIDLGGKSGNVEAALRDGQQRFLDAVDRIESGAFRPVRTSRGPASRCGFPHVCHQDYVGDE